MKYVIWGAGTQGRRFITGLTNVKFKAFVDVNTEKQGNVIGGLPVISPEELFASYRDCGVIVAINVRKKVEKVFSQLEANNIYKYCWLSECPGDLRFPRKQKTF